MTRILNTTNAVRIGCAALALIGVSIASPALADWQPRASVITQQMEAEAPTGDWQPRRAMMGTVSTRSTRHGDLRSSPRAATFVVGTASGPSRETLITWQPRATVAGHPTLRQPASSDWTPRASLKPGAIPAGTQARSNRERRLVSVETVPEDLATSSLTY